MVEYLAIDSFFFLLQKRKTYEIDNLKKDKDDFDFRSQLQGEKFDKRIKELETALGNARCVET